jgi:hypothetical protein
MTIPEIDIQLAGLKRAIAEEQGGKHTYKNDNIAIYENRHKDLTIELAALKKEEKERVYLPVAEVAEVADAVTAN